jgi:hypothetical protein
MTLANGQIVTQTGQLGPLQEVWFAVTATDADNRYINQEGATEDREDRAPLDLTMFVTPVDGNTIQNIRMDLFPLGYAAHWSHGHIFREGLSGDERDELEHAAPFGAGQISVISGEDDNTLYSFQGDGDTLVGKMTWSGRTNPNETFLVRVRNETGATIDFQLSTGNIDDFAVGQTSRTETGVASETVMAEEMAVTALPAGIDPNHPIQLVLNNDPTLVRTGSLPALQDVWFIVTPPSGMFDIDQNAEDAEDRVDAPALDLTMFITPVDGNTIDRFRMDLFPADYATHWSHGHIFSPGLSDDENDELEHAAPFGTGSVSVVTGEDDDSFYSFLAEGAAPLGKLVWSGRANPNEPFLVRVSNETGSARDYSLFSGDIGEVDLSQNQVAQTKTAAVAAETAVAEEMAMAALPAGIDPNHPIQMMLVNGQIVAQTGQLAAAQDVWFAVTTSDIDGRFVDQDGPEEDRLARSPLDLTLFVTPIEGNTVEKIDLEIFRADYATHWSHGHVYRIGLPESDQEDIEHAAPFGTGSVSVVTGEDDNSFYSFLAEGAASVGKVTWSGRANANETFLVRIANGTGADIDFTLYTADIVDFGN